MKKLDLAIVIIGKICSGKSTLAKDFSKWVNIPKASFGGYLEDLSLRKGMPTDRVSLQNLGAHFIESAPVSFLNDVINYKTANDTKIIFEGVRHTIVLDEIRKISKQTFAIYLDVDEATRLKRFVSREKDMDQNNAEIDFYDRSNHPVEQEAESLRKLCNFTLKTDEDYREFLKAIGLYK